MIAPASFQELVAHYPQLYVQQRKEWVEIIIDWETTNKYAVLDHAGTEVAFIAERSGGWTTMFKRWFLRSHRPFEIDVISKTSEVLLHLSRSFFWIFSDLLVASPSGENFGSVHRRFGVLHKKYDLRDEHGQLFARIKSPLWRLWTFPVEDLSGQTRSSINKRWGGALKEIFTDADTFQVDFGTHPWTDAQKAVLFAAAISIDFDFFENNQGSGGGGLFDLVD